MANNFNFQASLKLNSGGFKKGVNQVKSSLAGLKNSFLQVAGALGAGLGFTHLISSVKTTATELSVAMNTLKNVSYQTKFFKDGLEDVSVEVTNFAENLDYVKRLAQEYSQDLVAVTDNFAKFTAACKKTNLGLEDQRFVFESLTKAAAYYHLSADRTSDMMNAITQMMSKGKVAAEELRRQLGNTLPGAFNMMAAAIGVSTAELDNMMRNGQVIASEVLPQFAAMLNSVTQTAEFDSLQSSINQFKNAWYELVTSSGAEQLFKKIVDASTKAIEGIAENFGAIKAGVKGLLVYFAGVNLWQSFTRNGQVWLAEHQRQLAAAEKFLAMHYGRIQKLQKEGMVKQAASGAIRPTGALDTFNMGAITEYNHKLLETIRLQHQLGAITKKRFLAMSRDIERATQEVTGLNVALGTTAKKGVTSMSTLGASVSALGAKMKSIFASVGAFLKSNWVFMVIGLVTSLVSRAKELRKEMEEIRSIASNYANDTIKVKGTIDEQASTLRNNLKIVKDTRNKETERLYALQQINKQMGLVGDKAFNLEDLDKIKGKYDEITKSVEAWIKATQKQALVQHYANQIAELTAKKTDAERRQEEAWSTWAEWESGGDVSVLEGSKAKGEYSKAAAEIAQYNKAIKQAEDEMYKAGVAVADFFSKFDDGSKNNGVESSLQKLYEKYQKETKQLNNQLREGAINQEEFNESFDKLIQEYWKNAAAIGELTIDSVTDKMDKGTTLSTLENWYYKLSQDAAEAARNALLRGFLNETIATIDKEIEQSIDSIDEYFEKQNKAMDLDLGVAGGNYDTKKRGSRNSLFDYKTSGSDILNDEFNLSDNWLQDIKDSYGDLIEESNELGFRTEIVQEKLDELSEKYRYAAKEAATLEAAMNYAKVQEDIKELKQEIGGLVYSGIKDMATSMDRVVNAAETLKETMEDTDASGWERFMVVFNMITQIVDTAMGLYETINTIQQLSLKLGGAKIAEQTAYNALLAKELALRMAMKGASDEEIKNRIAGIGALFAEEGVLAGILGLKKKENQASATGIGLKAGEAAASAGAASASAGEAIAGATASGAKMPFPLNLIAIAAGIAAVVAALASMSKFAKGGIVGGNSAHGDHNLARVNSGEMILNKAQQGTLFKAISSGSLGGGNVEFKIKGADLVGTINNYSKKISK